VGATVEPLFRRGDPNADGAVDIGDPVPLLCNLFLGDPATLACLKGADADDGGTADLSDAIYLLTYLFLEGPAPKEPFEACGGDATPTGSPAKISLPAIRGGGDKPGDGGVKSRRTKEIPRRAPAVRGSRKGKEKRGPWPSR